jgi:mitochondrial import receptor subunit TOM20
VQSSVTIIGRGRREAEKQWLREQRNKQATTKKNYKKAWAEIKDEKYPTIPNEMERFFLNHVNQAETLMAQGLSPHVLIWVVLLNIMIGGPPVYLEGAKHFYLALKVYPNAVDLLDIYKKSLPAVRFISGFN